MHVLMLSLTLFGQADFGVPPSPAALPARAAAVPTAPLASAGESVEDLRTWLLTRLIVDMSFDAQKSVEVQGLINSMNEQQLRVLIGVYKERSAKRDQSTKAQQETSQQQALEQAKLNQQQAEAYRDHLKREYDFRILQGYMTQNLVYQNIVNNQRMMFLTGGPYTSAGIGYGPFGIGGMGYGGMGYGGMGYGGMGYGGMGYGGMGYGGMGYGMNYSYGGPMMYGSPSYGGGMGFY